ncbi:MAG: hypothetical protein MUE59_03795 [Thiobacillaceae bacterium]|nr:hypothetical protein [Thiobacillaceae bacterium]
MSIWIDKRGRRHVGIMAGGRRVHRIVHRILPAGATAGDAKQLEADLRAALAVSKTPAIPVDPKLTEIMSLYITHADTLRSSATAVHHANRIGPWCEKYRASQARMCAEHIVRDMTGHYAPATINRSLGTLKKSLRIAWERGLLPIDYSTHVKRLPEHNERSTVLTLDQVQAIAGRCSKPVRAAIWIALMTGARRGEHRAHRAGRAAVAGACAAGGVGRGNQNCVAARQGRGRIAGGEFSRPAAFVRIDPDRQRRGSVHRVEDPRARINQDDRALQPHADRAAAPGDDEGF